MNQNRLDLEIQLRPSLVRYHIFDDDTQYHCRYCGKRPGETFHLYFCMTDAEIKRAKAWQVAFEKAEQRAMRRKLLALTLGICATCTAIIIATIHAMVMLLG